MVAQPLTELLREADSAEELKHLVTRLRYAHSGTWVVAVYESAIIRDSVIDTLRRELAPLPVIVQTLQPKQWDILEVLDEISHNGVVAPVVCLLPTEDVLRDLFGYLDLQRERLAQTSYRLVLWVTGYSWRRLAQEAPNFYSRLSSVFLFSGIVASSQTNIQQHKGADTSPTASGLTSSSAPLDEQERKKRIAFLQRRIAERQGLPDPDATAIASDYAELGYLFQEDYSWQAALTAHMEAGRWYGRTNDLSAQASSLLQVGRILFFLKQSDDALVEYETAFTLYRTLEDRLGEANVLQAQGDVLAFLDRRDEALAKYEAALTLFRAVGDRLGEANVLKAQGDVLYFLKRTDEALAKYEAGLTLYRAVGDRLGEANVLKAQGDVLYFLKRTDEALAKYEAGLTLFRAVGDRLGEANVLLSQGDVARWAQDFGLAWESYDQAYRLYKMIGDHYSLARILYRIGDWYAAQNQREPAAHRYREAIVLWQAIGLDELVESILRPRLDAVT